MVRIPGESAAARNNERSWIGARWFPGPGGRGALEGCPCKLPICCADTDAIVAIIKHPKKATPATMTDPATILPPYALAVVEQPVAAVFGVP